MAVIFLGGLHNVNILSMIFRLLTRFWLILLHKHKDIWISNNTISQHTDDTDKFPPMKFISCVLVVKTKVTAPGSGIARNQGIRSYCIGLQVSIRDCPIFSLRKTKTYIWNYEKGYRKSNMNMKTAQVRLGGACLNH